jgi:membrane protein YdbS with pleckstrin-like domain
VSDRLLLAIRPARRSLLFGYFFSPLIFPLFYIWLKRRGTRLFVYEDRIVLRRGVLSKRENELFIRDIRSVRTSQGPLERLLGIGTIQIATAGTSGYEHTITGLAQPSKIKNKIISIMGKTGA